MKDITNSPLGSPLRNKSTIPRVGSSLRNQVQLTPTKIRNETPQDSPASRTRARIRAQLFQHEEEEEEAAEETDLQVLMMHDRSPFVALIERISQIPLMPFVIKSVSFVVSVAYVIVWGALEALNTVKPNRNTMSQIKRASGLFFIAAAMVYLVSLKSTAEIVELQTDSNYPSSMGSSSNQVDIDSKIDSIWTLMQNQLSPIHKRLISMEQQMQNMDTTILSKEEINNIIGEIKMEFIQKVFAVTGEMKETMQTDISNSLADKLLESKSQIIQEVRVMQIELLQKLYHSLNPLDQEKLENADEIFERIGAWRTALLSSLVPDHNTESEFYKKYGADYALYSAGAWIDIHNTSPTYNSHKDQISKFLRLPSGPDHILDDNLTPGHCWAMKGSSGYITIKLARPINISAVVVKHAPIHTLYEKGVNAAPKSMEIMNNAKLLQKFEFNPNKQADHLVEIVDENIYESITIKINSNWGNRKWTCLYRIAVHGKENI